jgi:hypothetical protein
VVLALGLSYLADYAGAMMVTKKNMAELLTSTEAEEYLKVRSRIVFCENLVRLPLSA